MLRASRATGHDDRVFAQSFEVSALEHLKAIAPAGPFGLLVEDIDPDPVERCRAVGAVAYNPDYREVIARPGSRPGAAARPGSPSRSGPPTIPSEWELLTAAGVDAIITNTPAELLAWQANGLLRGRRRSIQTHSR